MIGNESGPAMGVTRRDLGRFLAGLGSAGLLSRVGGPESRQQLPPRPESPDEDYWGKVRAQFLMPSGLAAMNSANLCPSSIPVLEELYATSRNIDADPSFQNRGKLADAKKNTRDILAASLGVTPEEIVFVRNTSEGNNLISSGLDLGPDDEVIIFADNHPSNHAAWRDKSERFGFSVEIIQAKTPAPGGEYYLEQFKAAINKRTRLIAFTHVTNTIGELFPAKQLCKLAKEHGILSLVDGAQSFGVLDLDLRDMGADFYSGSGHKWPCGPKEVGLLFIAKGSEEQLSPSIISLYGGPGVAERFELLGQRDDAAIVALGKALELQAEIGRDRIEARARELAQRLKQGLQKIPGVKIWTPLEAENSAAVVSFQPGDLDGRKVFGALYEREGIIAASRGGDRPGVRISPHFFGMQSEIDRALQAIEGYCRKGL
ncbi:MAG: aminotransferase class V-fold PLP-dependent enzyme [Planctomycetota bacterium]|jgi:selenocysteine lyase/cysteine desulfurase